jgi:hypothetical protein
MYACSCAYKTEDFHTKHKNMHNAQFILDSCNSNSLAIYNMCKQPLEPCTHRVQTRAHALCICRVIGIHTRCANTYTIAHTHTHTHTRHGHACNQKKNTNQSRFQTCMHASHQRWHTLFLSVIKKIISACTHIISAILSRNAAHTNMSRRARAHACTHRQTRRRTCLPGTYARHCTPKLGSFVCDS